MKATLRIVIIGYIVLSFGIAQAATIIDTGPGSGPGGATLGYQWLAGKFTLNQAYTITGIEGYMYALETYSGNFTIAVLGDNSNLPNPYNVLYQQTATAGYATSWYGLSGLDFALNPGTYWAVFKSDPDSAGALRAFVPAPVELPLAEYASAMKWDPTSWSLATDPMYHFGVKISGDAAAPVPIPEAVWLFCAGLIGLVGFRSKQK